MDVLVPVSMKNAANCEKECETQSRSHLIFERNWRFLLEASLLECVFPLLALGVLLDVSWGVLKALKEAPVDA